MDEPNEMLMEDFTHGLYMNVMWINIGVWCLVGLNVVDLVW